MRYHIRRAYLSNTSDARNLSRLDEALLPGSSETTEHTDAGAWWLLECVDDEGDAETIGYVGARILEKGELAAGSAYLMRVGVTPEHTGRGLGKRLLRVANQWAKRQGAPDIQTYTIDNPASANNLIGVGYRQFLADWSIPGDGVSYWRLRF
jgi:GNAT superfamily N-acetyltransferase